MQANALGVGADGVVLQSTTGGGGGGSGGGDGGGGGEQGWHVPTFTKPQYWFQHCSQTTAVNLRIALWETAVQTCRAGRPADTDMRAVESFQ